MRERKNSSPVAPGLQQVRNSWFGLRFRARRKASMKKKEVLELLKQFPDEVNAERLMYGLYLKAKLDQAEAAVQSGDVLSHEEVVKQTQQWFE